MNIAVVINRAVGPRHVGHDRKKTVENKKRERRLEGGKLPVGEELAQTAAALPDICWARKVQREIELQ